MDIQFGSLENLNYLWLVAAVCVVFALAAVSRRRATARFATPNLADAIFKSRQSRSWIRTAVPLASLAFLVLALTDVRWGKTWREVPQKGIEVVFVLDVSRSMLAEDVTPNRLGRAKQQIKDMVDEMHGDRIGLVVFAGEATRKIPLTSHYDDFKRTLDEVGPRDVQLGGSSLGDAIRVAGEAFLTKTSDHKAIVLFTDGEDHESKPVAAAKKGYRDRGIRIFTIGLGDDSRGARLPVELANRGSSYLEYDGQQVWSKMDGSILKEIAMATDGAYVPAGTKSVDMSRVYRDYVAQVEQQDFATAHINGYIPRFQWFLGTALLLTVLESLMTISTPRNSRSAADSTVNENIRVSASRRTTKKSIAAAIAVVALYLVGASSTQAAEADVHRLVEEATRLMQAGNYEEAAETYRQANEIAPHTYELQYDQAVALYRNGDLDRARQLFTAATSSSNRQLEAKARFNLANCDFADALQLAEKDPNTAKQKARSAISHYRGTLAANPNDGDARTNIELASLLIRQLDERDQNEQKSDPQNNQSQEQDQTDKQQDIQPPSANDQNKESQNGKSDDRQQSPEDSSEGRSKSETSEDNPSKATPDESSSENAQPSADSSNDNDPENGSQDDHRDSDSRTTGDATSHQGDQSDDPDGETTESAADRAASDANHDQQTPTQPHPTPPSESSQNESTDTPTPQPLESDYDTSGKSETQPASNASSVNGSPVRRRQGDLDAMGDEAGRPTAQSDLSGHLEDLTKPMTRQEAMKLLQSVRDRDLMRRLQNQRKVQRRYIPGNKDW